MNNKINNIIPSQKNMENLEDINEEKNLETPEEIEINFNSHQELISHLKSIQGEEKDKIVEAFFKFSKTDKHWENVIQRGFLGYFCESGDKEKAEKVIGLCLDPRSQEGRIKKFEKFFGKYEGERAQPIVQKITDEEREILEQSFEISSTSKFREALDLGLLDIAEMWINNIKDSENYKNLKGDNLKNFLRDRAKELQDEKNRRNVK